MTISFLDTEFTGLGQRTPLLISLGLVSEDGRHTFYAELPPDTYQPECAPWVRENVLPLLDGGDRILPLDELGRRLTEWIGALGPVRIATDAPDYDFALLISVLVPWPANVDPKPIWFDSYTLGSVHQELLESYREGYFQSEKLEHHALHDAQALRRTWLRAKPLDAFQAFATEHRL
jgi:hypothetical protein